MKRVASPKAIRVACLIDQAAESAYKNGEVGLHGQVLGKIQGRAAWINCRWLEAVPREVPMADVERGLSLMGWRKRRMSWPVIDQGLFQAGGWWKRFDS